MHDKPTRELLERLKAIEERLDGLDKSQRQLQEAYARSRAHLRRFWLRPPMWTFEQHSPHPLDLHSLPILGYCSCTTRDSVRCAGMASSGW